MEVRVFGDLIDFLGSSKLTIELGEGAKVADLISKMAEVKAGFREKMEVLSRRRGATDYGLTILVNGKNINVLNGLETQLKDGDTVVFLPPVAGG
ncbi:MoaD/ThiS family protein [Candidatus Bathyarchaeota archaeon]|nr:MoaD/ThiS family protein [Candidatus Bathyarchaeota archaeon]